MASVRPFSRKPTAAEPTDISLLSSTMNRLPTDAHSCEYYKSRGSAELYVDFNRLDNPNPF